MTEPFEPRTSSGAQAGGGPQPPAVLAALERFQPLRRAERALLKACLRGEIARASLRRPAQPEPELTVRADFLAALLRVGGAGPARRVQLLGAWIEGRLDLSDLPVAGSLWFYRCVFDEVPVFDGARIAGSLSFPDCRLPGLLAERCRIGDTLALNAGCTVHGELRLRRTRIGAQLDAQRLQLEAPVDAPAAFAALVADDLVVAGDLRLDHARIGAGLRLAGARIGGDLEAGGASLSAPLHADGHRGAALFAERLRVEGSVRLGRLASAGGVRLGRARIGGDLDCSGAALDRTGDAAWGDGQALCLARARIGGAFALQRLPVPLVGVSLADARVGELVDDASSWGERLVLDGFRYGRLGDGAPLEAAFRLAWLERQPSDQLGSDFRLQPWKRLIRVLRRMGQADVADELVVQREARLRRSGRIGLGLPAVLRAGAELLHTAYGVLAGYGVRLHRLPAALLLAWLASAAAYAGLEAAGGPLEALRLSLQQLLPGAARGLPGAVHPAASAIAWAQTLFGWAALGMAMASFCGWLERRRGG